MHQTAITVRIHGETGAKYRTEEARTGDEEEQRLY